METGGKEQRGGRRDVEIVGIFLLVLGIPTIVALIREARERKKRIP
jgi:hypothetical protein